MKASILSSLLTFTAIGLVLPLSVAAQTADPAAAAGSAPAATEVSAMAQSADPLSAAAEKLLDESGVIARQSRVGEDVIVLDRETTRAEQIQALINLVGLDGLRTLYPDLAAGLETSPIAIQSQINTVNLIHELEAAIKGPEEEKTDEAAVAANAQAQPNDPGFINMAVAPLASEDGSVVMTPEDIEKIKAEERAAVQAEMMAQNQAAAEEVPPVSLREIYGGDGQMNAIVAIGSDRMRIREGDELPGGMIVRKINLDSIQIDRNGEILDIPIRG